MKKKWVTEYDEFADVLYVTLKNYNQIYKCGCAVSRSPQDLDDLSIQVMTIHPNNEGEELVVVGLIITDFSKLHKRRDLESLREYWDEANIDRPEDPAEDVEERLERGEEFRIISSTATRDPRSLTKLRVGDIIKIKFRGDSWFSICAEVENVGLEDFDKELKVSKIEWFDKKGRLEGYEELDHIFVFNVKDNPHLLADLRIPNDLVDELDIEIIEEGDLMAGTTFKE